MKKYTILLVFIAFVISINFTDKSERKLLLSAISEEPVLPFPPFNYKIDSFPAHLFSDTIDQGFNGRLHSNYVRDLFPIDDDKATLGRVLFYDTRLSASENISCASCHDQKLSFADNKVLSEGGNSLTKRNSLHLNDLVWERPTRFGWDMKHERLDEMISIPLRDENEIDIDIEDVITKFYNTIHYPQLFQIAYGHPLATEEKIIESLTHYIFSMASFNSRHDQQAAVDFIDFTDSELLGLQLFSFHCNSCHKQGSGQWLPDERLNNGIPTSSNDLGAGEWDTTFNHMFKMATLRNIELTAPYMHDGRHATLEDVVKHYSDSIQVVFEQTGFESWQFLPEGGFDFTEEEQKALVDFMKTFTDVSFTTNEKWADPFRDRTSIENIVLESKIRLYPNPMSHSSKLEFENPKNKLAKLQLLHANGTLIKTFETNENYFTIEKDFLNPGLYFINLSVGTRKLTKKLIVK